MTYDEILAQVTREGQQEKIESIFYTTYENICSIYGGEENIPPFHLANIRGALTRAKTYALVPSENPNGPAPQLITDPAGKSARDDSHR